MYVPGLGIYASKGPVTNPQTAVANLFTITGAVLITYLIGRVSTIMGAVGNNMSLEHDLGPAVLCAVLATANDDVPTRYHISGDPAEPLRKFTAFAPGGMRGGLAAGAGLIANGIVALPGHITIRCSGNNTGATTWACYWIPLEAGSTLVAS